MKRKLIALNLALVALVAGAAWQLRRQWLEGKAREQKMFRQPGRLSSEAVAPPLQPPGPVTAAGYGAIADRMLFSKDRNPDVVIETEVPKPPPPLPVARGVMNFGEGPVVILSEKSGAPDRGLSPGDKIGEFTLVAVGKEEIVFEWEGQRLKQKLSELFVPDAAEAAKPSAEPAAPSAPVVQTTVVTPQGETGPGPVIGDEIRACLPGDTSPPGTIKDGLKKVVILGPFGRQCRWEPVK